jgi:type IV secretory pathway TraG/TraD family ATPase VirD4
VLAHTLIPRFLQRVLGIPLSTLYGEARWMGFFERRRFLSARHRGLVLSPRHRLSEKESFKSLVLVAPTGSGKTTRYVIPNLLQLTGSAVVTDPSGEIYAATSGHLLKRGYRIQVLQPETPGKSLSFNPLAYFRTDAELRRLATILAETAKSYESIWNVGATNLLYFGLQAITVLPQAEERSIANLRRLLNTLSADETAVDGFMSRCLTGEAFGEYRAFMGQEDKMKSSFISSARAALDLWSDADVKRLTGRNTVDIGGLREQPTVIYLIVPEHKISYFAVILNLFYTACFEHCLQHWNRDNRADRKRLLPVYFFLDEFGNLGKINNFRSMITTLRKRECSLSLILQEKAQLNALYEKDAQTIFGGGCGHKLFFTGLDTETCRYLETTLGQQTECDVDRDGAEREERKVGAPLMRHDEIRMLSARKAILVSGGKRPVLFKMPPYYRVSALRKKTALPPVPCPVHQTEAATAPAVGADGRPWFLQTEAVQRERLTPISAT